MAIGHDGDAATAAGRCLTMRIDYADVLVIGGGLAKAGDLYLDALRKAMRERAQPIAGNKVRVVASRLRGDANLLGAARVAWEGGRSKRRTV